MQPETLFPIEPIVRQRGAYSVRNLRLVADVVCETPTEVLDYPEDAVRYMRGALDAYPDQEQMWVIPLNSRNRPLGRVLVTVGTLKSTLASPREVFRPAIVASAATVVVVHNHPSGDPSASSADHAITTKLKQSGELLDIPLNDHVIIGDAAVDPLGLGYFSFKRAGLL